MTVTARILAPSLAGSLALVGCACLFDSVLAHFSAGYRVGLSPAVFAAAGFIIGAALRSMLVWTQEDDAVGTMAGAILPWAGGLLMFAALLFPRELNDHAGAPIGVAKHFASVSYLAGVCIFSFFLLPSAFRSREPGKIAGALIIIIILISLVTGIQPPNESDEGDYVASAIAIVTTASTRVDRATLNGDLRQYYGNNFPSTWRTFEKSAWLGSPPHNYSLRASGYPLVLAPFVAIARRTANLTLRWYITYLSGVLGFFCFVRLMQLLVRKMRSINHFPLVAASLSLPVIYYVTETLPELWLAAGMTGCLAICAGENGGQRKWPALGLVSIGLLVLHERIFPATAVFVAAGYIRTNQKARYLIWTAAAMLILAVADFSPIAYRITRWLPDQSGWGSADFLDFARMASNGFTFLFSPVTGLLFLFPTLGVALAGLHSKDQPVRIGLAAFAAYFAMLLVYPDPMDSVPHGRFLLPIVPALLPALIRGAERLSCSRAGKLFMNLTLTAQIALAVPYLAIPTAWRVSGFYIFTLPR